ncbi:uncharacterized protein [Drosophila takahashii]|uniref:uncharacterized protein n=1 Tax=Drosophila takahashii TaxID=29030 RepID=UPI003898F384
MEQHMLKRLIQARGRLKATTTRLVNYIENPPPQSTYSVVDAMLERLNQAFKSLEEVTDEMHLYDNVEGFEDPSEDFQTYEEKYLHALTLFASLKSNLQSSAIPQADQNIATLLQQQIGEAANLLSHMSITESAYNSARELLNERYNRPRHIVNSLLDTFMELVAAPNGEVSNLRKLTDGANNIIRGLDAVGETSRDCWVIHLVLAKIDSDSRSKWIEDTRGAATPTVTDLFKFLDDRCEDFELSQATSAIQLDPGSHTDKPAKTKRALIAVKSGNCAHLLGKITSSLQRDDINETALRIYDGLQLADTSFNTSSPVDILLGNEQIWSVLSGDKKYDADGNIIPISSIFGWIITSVAMPHPLTANTLVTTVDINASLQRFWEIEDNTDHTQQDPSHEKDEHHFLTTLSRDPDGKYIVELPFKHESQEFGDSLPGAVSRFYAVERRLQLTYGTSCAPFLAVRVLEQLARDHQDEFPTASKIVLEDFYVDDVLTGAETEDELLSRRDELIQLMSKAKLELGKWVSDSSRLSHERQGELPITSAVKVLGMHWNPQDDVLSYKTSLSTEADATKRQVLSDVSRIFDPLGILAPVVVQFKILFQELWLLDLDWDSKLPPKLAEWWQTCRDDINCITNQRIPRFVPSESGKIELHGFSDASIKAYAAVVYSRVSNADGTCLVSLMAAKTRVAPLKQQSLPRLELCGALLLTRLLRAVKEGLQHKDITVHAWCDSTIVLSWLSPTPSKLKTFIANRTSEILDVIPRSAWHHVGSKDNPADCASRGMLAANLMSYELWWKGPHWLHHNDLLALKLRSGNNPNTILDTPIMEGLKSSSLCSRIESNPEASSIECLSLRVSSWTKLIRCTGYVLRFINRSRMMKRIPSSLTLTFEEISEARIYCLRHAQEGFSSDIHLLQSGKAVANSSTLRTLSPIVCKNFLLRVGGRLSNSLLPEEVKHPIILPKGHRISLLILEHEHRIHLHPGLTALFVIVRQQYWIVGARNMIRKPTHSCHKCFRQRHKTADQYMADLPAVRVRQAYPFDNTGSSAINLELATDLGSRRHFSLHFVVLSPMQASVPTSSATTVATDMYKLILSQQHNTQVTQSLASEGIKWSFIPPHAPHWMHTLLAQIESVVNSRPLFATSDTEVSYLSPAHLLIGRPYTSVPEGDLGHIAVNRLDYWQNVQAMLQGFWKRWHQEYLTTLQQRPKWNTERKNVATGDIAIIKDSNTPPAAWALAHVIGVYPGKDGLVRAVKLRLSSGEPVRPISELPFCLIQKLSFRVGRDVEEPYN